MIAQRSRGGLTLLEMLLVLFLFSAIAYSPVSLTDRQDLQSRFDDTAVRLKNIRRAVVGDPNREANNSPIVSGFVADLGRLPNNLQELVEQGSLPSWQFDATSNQWFGWRGPYLDTIREMQSGLKAFRDGWGNIDPIPVNDALNFGWNVIVEPSPGELVVQSYGSDGLVGGAPGDVYAADYPPLVDPFVKRDDHQIDIQSWIVTISFYNPVGGKQLPKKNAQLRVRLYLPQNGSIGSIDSNSTTLRKKSVADGSTMDLDFVFPAAPQLIPWGVRSLVVIDKKGKVYVPASNVPRNATFVPRAQLPTLGFTWNLE